MTFLLVLVAEDVKDRFSANLLKIKNIIGRPFQARQGGIFADINKFMSPLPNILIAFETALSESSPNTALSISANQ